MAAERHKYGNPPIQEAICEIHFAIDEPLPPQRLEQLKPRWAAEYPNQTINEEKGVHLQMGADGVRVDENMLGKRLICRTNDGTRLTQLSGRFLAVNQLKPYPGWEENYRDTILARLSDVESELGAMPIHRTGLRYINKVEVPENPVIWENWFNFALPFPKLEKSLLSNFQMHFEQILPEKQKLVVHCVSLPQSAELSFVILDLDVIWEGEPITSGELPRLLEGVHRPHRLAFEAYITDKLRERFDRKS
jgi:uncharacterized protein (TIGR04255 family)